MRRAEPSPQAAALYRRELLPWALSGFTLGMVEGATAAVLVKRGFTGLAAPAAVNLAVAFVSGAPALSNMVSFVWANLAQGREKVRLVVDQIRGRQVEDALGILATSTKRVARPLAKLVRSALANAEEKNAREKAGIDVDNLYVSRIVVDEGTSQWRVRARAQGRANWIQRRTSHVTLELEER